MKLTKEHLLKVEKCSPLLPPPGPEVVEELLGHIYALEADLRLERAATLREAAEMADTAIREEFRKGWAERPESGPRAEIVAKYAHWAILSLGDERALDRHDAELKAQTAAMLEKAAAINEEYERRICEDFNSLSGTEPRVHQQIRALISTDYAAALKGCVQQAVQEAQLQEAELRPHDGECLMFNGDGSKTGLDCTCTRGKRIALHRAAAGSQTRDGNG